MFEKIKKSKKFDLLMELKKNGIIDKSVLNIIESVDRSFFVDENLKQKIKSKYCFADRLWPNNIPTLSSGSYDTVT